MSKTTVSKTPPTAKFPYNSERTKNGATILTIYGPCADGYYAGVVADGKNVLGCTWDEEGEDTESPDFNLVPNNSPKKENSTFKKVK